MDAKDTQSIDDKFINEIIKENVIQITENVNKQIILDQETTLRFEILLNT